MLLEATFGRESRYSLTTTPSGQAFRLDSLTGEISMVTNDDLIVLGPRAQTKLVVGNYYKLEFGEIAKYLGNK